MSRRRDFYTGPRCEHPVDRGGFCERPATQHRPGSGRSGNCFWFCVDHAEQYDREHPAAAEKGAPREPDVLRRVLVDLRVAFDDADAITADMLRSPRRRELGPALHRQNYGEARTKIAGILSRLLGEPQPEPGPASGAPPTH